MDSGSTSSCRFDSQVEGVVQVPRENVNKFLKITHKRHPHKVEMRISKQYERRLQASSANLQVRHLAHSPTLPSVRDEPLGVCGSVVTHKQQEFVSIMSEEGGPYLVEGLRGFTAWRVSCRNAWALQTRL